MEFVQYLPEAHLLNAVAARCADPAIADDLKYVLATANAMAAGRYQVAYCPSLVRGQGYYTGMVFEITCPQFSGAVAGGGRYDNMVGKFLGTQVPAVGFSIGFERVCGILLEQGYQSRLTPDDCTIKTICKAANKGDALACEVIEYVGRHLGKTIAIAINLFNPQKIVVAGEIVEAEKVLLPAIEGCINAQALKAFRKNLPVVRSTLDHRSAIGAFALVKRAMLNGTLLQRLLES